MTQDRKEILVFTAAALVLCILFLGNPVKLLEAAPVPAVSNHTHCVDHHCSQY